MKALWAGDDGLYYLEETRDGPADLYPDGKATGRWLGDGAARLGLDGAVDRVDFARVLAGSDPASGAMLVSGKAAAEGRTPGYDLTFSAPKSVSLLSALGDQEVGEQVRLAHRAAVAEAMRLVEDEVAMVRRGAGGARQLPAELVAAAFEHHASRALDPQLHTHVVVANMGFSGDDDRWSALYGRRFYGWAKTAGYAYQSVLRAELTERLGVAWGPVVNGMAEMQGFSKSQLRSFSHRKEEIDAELERAGQSSARSAQLASWATRAAKEHVPYDELLAKWRERAAEVGLTEDRLRDVTHPRRAHPLPAPSDGDRDRLAERLLGPTGLTAHASAFDRRHVLQAAAQAAAAGARLSELTAAADRVLADEQAVELPERSKLGDRRYSTAELLATEQALLEGADQRRHAGVGAAKASALAAALGRRPTLSDEQRNMVTALTTSGDGVQAVVGVAGSGKTFALDAARDAWQASGIQVLGAALAARAAAELQAGSGIPSTTLDRLLLDAERPEIGLPRGGVVVIDEAGMVGTRKLARLLNLADKYDAAVVLVGDPRQLPEIDAGGAFAALAARLPKVELHANRRQVEGWEREALADLRAGNVGDAIVAYRDHRRITIAATAEGARNRLVADWFDAHQTGGDAAMYALRRDDVDDLNRRARLLLADSGRLTGPELHVGGRGFRVGDEVMTLRNDRRLGVVNGGLGTVVGVDLAARSVTVDLGNGDQAVLPARYLDDGHLDYGYAATIHKAEGATVDRAFLLGSDGLYREAGYTALSRSRIRTDLYLNGDTPGLDLDGKDLAMSDDLLPSRETARDPSDDLRRGQPPDTEWDPIARLAGNLSHSSAQQLASAPRHVDRGDGRTLAALEDEASRLRQAIGTPPPRPERDAAVRYEEARAFREDAERRLQDAERLPRRRRAGPEAIARQVWADASAAEWRAANDYAAAQDAGAAWDRWLADRAQPMADYLALTREIGDARRALQAADTADPASYHLDALGPPPLHGTARKLWAEAAADLDAYRQRWDVDSPDPLGPEPADPVHARQRDLLQSHLDDTRKRLDQNRGLSRGLDVGIGL